MIERRYIELIHRELDGAVSEAEKAQLAAYLASNSEARELYQRMSGLSESLSEMTECDPPPNLRHDILAAIRYRQHAKAEYENTFRRFWSFLGATGKLRYGITFAAGVVVGGLLWAFSPIEWHGARALSNLDVSGTILNRSSVPLLNWSHSREFHASGVDGRIAARVAADTLEVDLALTSNREVAIALESDPAALTLRAFRQVQPDPVRLETLPDRVRMAHAGRNEYAFTFEGWSERSGRLVIRIHGDGVLLYEDVVTRESGERRETR